VKINASVSDPPLVSMVLTFTIEGDKEQADPTDVLFRSHQALEELMAWLLTSSTL
jgi:hypothetical protein